jgi:hypothetical protein
MQVLISDATITEVLHESESITRAIAGCFLFFTLIRYFEFRTKLLPTKSPPKSAQLAKLSLRPLL